MTLLKTSEESAISSRKRFKENPSLRRRLLLVLLTLITGAWVVTLGTSYLKTQHEVETLFDAQLAQVAYALLEIKPKKGAADNITLQHIEKKIITHPYNKKIAFQIWQDNKLLLHSNNAPSIKLTEIEDYHDTIIKNRQWRVFAIYSDDILIEVGEDMEIRNQLIQGIVLDMLLPMLVALPIIAIMIWIGIGAGIVPLRKITYAIRKRSHNQLEPLDITHTPQEISPLVEELNDLLARLDDAFIKERNFTANASHELRTPLAVIKTQAQVALRSRSNKERKENLQKIITGVDRATYMVSQLLTLARIDPDSAETLHKPLNLKKITSHIVAELAPLALHKHIDISLKGEDKAIILGYREGLQLMITNLIDNAVTYTPDGGKIEVSVIETLENVQLIVRDNGCGIPEEQREKVFERFYRLQGYKSGGCGIGLAIVKRVAELHNAQIMLDTPKKGNGLIVQITFDR